VLRQRSQDYGARRGGSSGGDPENELRFSASGQSFAPLQQPAVAASGLDRERELRLPVLRQRNVNYGTNRGGSSGGDPENERRRSASGQSFMQQEQQPAISGEDAARRPPVLRRRSPDYSAQREGSSGADPENERWRSSLGVGSSGSVGNSNRQGSPESLLRDREIEGMQEAHGAAEERSADILGGPQRTVDYSAAHGGTSGGDPENSWRRSSSGQGFVQLQQQQQEPAVGELSQSQSPVLRQRSVDYSARRGGSSGEDPENLRRQSSSTQCFAAPQQQQQEPAVREVGRSEPRILRLRSVDYSAQRRGASGSDTENLRRGPSQDQGFVQSQQQQPEPAEREVGRSQPRVLRQRSVDYSTRQGGSSGGDPENL
jgi:hypothetical protein